MPGWPNLMFFWVCRLGMKFDGGIRGKRVRRADLNYLAVGQERTLGAAEPVGDKIG